MLVVSFVVVDDAAKKETRLDTVRGGVTEETKCWPWKTYGAQGAWTAAKIEQRLREANRKPEEKAA